MQTPPTTTLTPERKEAARRFLLERAHPLEAALFRRHFEGGSDESVLTALARHQNDDGGFGHALEPDLRAPESSAIAMSIALEELRKIGAVGSSSMAGRAFDWLARTFIESMPGWRIAPLAVESSPHAPWWNQTGRATNYDQFSLNPTAELLGFAYERPGALSSEIVERVAAAVARELSKSATLEMHDVLCCLRLLASPGIPPPLFAALHSKLAATLDAVVVRDPAKWHEYGLRPLQVVDGPSSVFFRSFESDIRANLDFELAAQQPDGSWQPTWSWGGAYPDAWPAAQREWAGVLTLKALVTLHRFGRLPIDRPRTR